MQRLWQFGKLRQQENQVHLLRGLVATRAELARFHAGELGAALERTASPLARVGFAGGAGMALGLAVNLVGGQGADSKEHDKQGGAGQPVPPPQTSADREREQARDNERDTEQDAKQDADDRFLDAAKASEIAERLVTGLVVRAAIKYLPELKSSDASESR